MTTVSFLLSQLSQNEFPLNAQILYIKKSTTNTLILNLCMGQCNFTEEKILVQLIQLLHPIHPTLGYQMNLKEEREKGGHLALGNHTHQGKDTDPPMPQVTDTHAVIPFPTKEHDLTNS